MAGGPRLGRLRRHLAAAALTAALTAALATSLVGCASDGPAPSAGSSTTTDATRPTTPGTAPGTTAGTTVATVAPAGTVAPAPTTTTAAPPATVPTTVAPPAGTPRPGGPIRPAHVDPILPGPCPETTGRVERLTFQSNVLAIDQPVQRYRVYTPPCYRYGATRYPVVYLFHGAQTDESQWDEVGIFATTDRLIAAGAIPPMVVVLPDGIWAMGTYVGTPPLFDRFMLGEVMPAIEQDYRTIPDRRARGIGGISRGGEWALLLGGRHPDLFASVAGNSPAVGPPSSPNSVLVPLYQAPGHAAQRRWLDVGESDGLIGPVTSLHQAWDAAGITHELHTAPGGHDRAYWGAQSEAYLRFFAAAFTT